MILTKIKLVGVEVGAEGIAGSHHATSKREINKCKCSM